MPPAINETQAKDTGLAIVLVLLLLTQWGARYYLLLPAIVILVLTMATPGMFQLPARFWFGFSHLLGGFVSRLLLASVFYLIATPIGLVRSMAGADAMKTMMWKKDTSSVFTKRDHVFVRADLEKPY